MPLRILILHEQRLFREALRALLDGRFDLKIVAEAANAREAAPVILEAQPHVLVIDLRDACEAPRVQARLVALGEDDDAPHVVQALEAGIHALASKNDTAEEVATAIRAAAAGRIYVTSRLSVPHPAAPQAPQPPAVLADLTAREREIFAWVVRGTPTSSIAQQLGVSPRTVETHRAHLSRKLGVRSAADLVRFAARHGLLAG